MVLTRNGVMINTLNSFNVSNGVKQGVISPLLFGCYIEKLFSQLQHSGLGCHVGTSYARDFCYTDGIAIVAPSMQRLKKMIIMWSFHLKSPKILHGSNPDFDESALSDPCDRNRKNPSL